MLLDVLDILNQLLVFVTKIKNLLLSDHSLTFDKPETWKFYKRVNISDN